MDFYHAAEHLHELCRLARPGTRRRRTPSSRSGGVIGSGEVEGSCRSLVNQRADLSGQRWHPQGALNVLRISGMIIDDIHAAYWRKRGQPLPPPSA